VRRRALRHDLPIRLQGVAAPEWDTPTGAAATAALRDLVLGKVVTCESDGLTTHDRCAAICRLEGADVAAELVRLGLARDCPRYSGGRYHDAELAAADRGATIGETYRLPEYCDGI
jgi:micrococcal nuclease